MSVALAPSAESAEQAQVALRQLDKVALKKSTKSLQLQADKQKVSVTIPREAFELFLEILGQIANGNAVTIVPVHTELTTQQAADMLNVSRPFLIQLLEEKRIPYRKVGTHRRVLFSDLVAYKRKDDTQRKAIADELTAEAQKLGLEY